MYAKSFTALDGNGRLTGACTAQHYPYDSAAVHCNIILSTTLNARGLNIPKMR